MESLNFSVSMCVYGKDNPIYFDSAIESVLLQTVIPNEIVITVDGPIPQSIEDVIDKYQRNLDNSMTIFKVVRLRNNMGHGKARRICFENCTYPLVAVMDADDIASEQRFEKEIEAFKADEKLSIVGSHIAEFIGSIDTIIGKRIVKLNDSEIKEDMKKRCPMNQPTVMFKKEDIAEVGGYVDWFCNEDYYLWIRLAQAGKKFRNIDECLVNMRVDENSYQRRGGLKYFQSEVKIQKYMLDNRMINKHVYLINVIKRFIVQVCMPNGTRGWVFRTFARK